MRGMTGSQGAGARWGHSGGVVGTHACPRISNTPPILEIVVALNTPFFCFQGEICFNTPLFIDFKAFTEFFITSTCTVCIWELSPLSKMSSQRPVKTPTINVHWVPNANNPVTTLAIDRVRVLLGFLDNTLYFKNAELSEKAPLFLKIADRDTAEKKDPFPRF
jgi:hypothetical protein